MLGRNLATVLNSSANAQLIKSYAFILPIRSSIRVKTHTQRRLYATPGRPKKAVGETSRPIKRTVKKTTNKATKENTQADETASKQATAARQAAKKEAAAKKAADKKRANAEKQKLKAEAAKVKAKEKAAKAKAKEKAAKAKAKSKAKKPLTEKQVAIRDQKAAKLETQELKQAALNPPKISPASAFHQFAKLKHSSDRPTGLSPQGALSFMMKNIAQSWKTISLEEREHFNHLAHTAKDEQLAAYRNWVLSHTPEEIVIANKARASLRRRLKTRRSDTAWPRIQDERAVKKPVGPFLRFSANRLKSPDFVHISPRDRAKLIGAEWKKLGEDEKKRYQSMAAEDSQRYVAEYNKVNHHEPPVQQQAAASAA